MYVCIILGDKYMIDVSLSMVEVDWLVANFISEAMLNSQIKKGGN
jgi:hypothetical protein